VGNVGVSGKKTLKLIKEVKGRENGVI